MLSTTTDWLDLSERDVRLAWSSVVPAAFVLILCIGHLPLPAPITKVISFISTPFKNFLTLPEAEAYDTGEYPIRESPPKNNAPIWLTLFLSWAALMETVFWMGLASYELAAVNDNREDTKYAIWTVLKAVSWLYASIKPVVRPTSTAPFDLFTLYIVQLCTAVLDFGGILFDHTAYGLPLPGKFAIAAQVVNLVVISTLLFIVLTRPLAIPSENVDRNEIGKSISPEDYTSLWGWVSFTWVVPLVRRGTYATLNESDVWALSPTIQARPCFLKFKDTKAKSLLRQIWATNSLDLILDFVLTFVSVAFNYLSPFFLKRILDSLSLDPPSQEKRSEAYIYACLAFLCSILKSQADVQHLWFGRRAATRLRSELMSAIYDKALKRKDFSGIVDKAGKDATGDKKEKEKSDDPKAGADVGKIVNLMSGDANRVAMTVTALTFIYGAPFEIIIACTFLYQLMGISAFAGFAVLLLGWPLNSYLARRSIRIQKGTLAARDKRMGVLNELIGSVKFIKFFAWEDRWIDRAMDARKTEIDWMIKGRINAVFFQTLWVTASIVVSVISFFVYVSLGNELTVGIAFTAIALFNMLRQPLNVIPTWIVQLLQTKVALDRIETFLKEDEVTEQVSTLKAKTSAQGTFYYDSFGLNNASFRWNAVEQESDDKKKSPATPTEVQADSVNGSQDNGTDHRFELRDISLILPEGELTVITGPTASGKSALLLAMLGEMTLLPGGEIIMTKDTTRVDEYGFTHSISYAAQSPWLQHQSIKENILFGTPYDEDRYNQVIECCALRPDLDILEDGDATEIGARGVSLSGGQKARVALARAVYNRSRYVLLDDPLSAVDSHTARFLYERLFLGPLMKHRTIALVTHHVELVLPGAYYLVRMLDGRIDTQGTVKDLQTKGLLDVIVHDTSTEVQIKEEEAVEASAEPTEAINKVDKPAKEVRKLIQEEERETGGVKWEIYKTYLRASSYWTWVIITVLILLSQLIAVADKYWIMIWGEAYETKSSVISPYSFVTFGAREQDLFFDNLHSTYRLHGYQLQFSDSAPWWNIPAHLPSAREHPLFYVGVYASIAALYVLVNIFSVAVTYIGGIRASKILFKNLLYSVIHATMRWHDVTPAGRMLNRFSKDIETVDSSLSSSLQTVNSTLASFFASVLVVTIVFPAFIIPASILGYFYYVLSLGYLNTGRDLRRMESTSRSPIFSGFSELLEGIVTVRAFSAERRFLNNLYKKIDRTTVMWYAFWMTNRWLLLHFDALGALAVLITTLLALYGVVGGGLAGFVITSAMTFTGNIYWACRFWTQLELDLNSVERVVEYLKLPQEPPAIVESNRPPAHWPSASKDEPLLVVENLHIKYAPDLPSVLHGLSFSLNAGERVGLLGRTGSGKSTLAMSILRFVDPTTGKILIGGLDVTTIGVHDLRERITFIPQDAALFSGTLRENIDPFGDFTDMECLDVLYRVQLLTESVYLSQKSSREPSRAPSIHEANGEEGAPSSGSRSPTATEVDSKTKISLDTQVSAGGSNFSQGQRQLIALARALLRQSSIIILDEATSSIDFSTDAKIQTTIREEFNNSLLLTVAHRLRTVIDYDRLIVLDKGQIAEIDTPYNLIRKEGGIFRDMCMKSGTFSELEEAAKKKAQQG